VHAGKMLIFGAMLRCTDPLLTVAAAVSYSRQVFMSPQTAREEADAARRRIAGPTLAYKSDHLATVYAFAQYRTVKEESGEKGAREWCVESFVSHEGMRAVQEGRAELVNSLLNLGFVSTGVCQWWGCKPHPSSHTTFKC
jgi:HrpA-like RNA helicase